MWWGQNRKFLLNIKYIMSDCVLMIRFGICVDVQGDGAYVD